MAPPPARRSDGEAAADGPRSLPTPFLTKTYQLVEDKSIDDVISWNEDGSSFVVWNTAEFASDLLPKYFKHNNFSSFVRQLNTYGFRKVMPDRWEFSNDYFKKGEKHLLCEIQRRKITASAAVAAPTAEVVTISPSNSGEEQVLSSSNSPAPVVREFNGTTTDLMGENERLRKENMQLNKELSQMKSMCNNIYLLMSNFGGSGNNNNSCNNSAVKPLDLLPMERYKDEMEVDGVGGGGEESGSIKSAAEEISATLFGWPIGGSKRGRSGEGSSGTGEEMMDLQLQLPGSGGGGEVKCEGLGGSGGGDEEESSSLRRSDSVRSQRVCN